MNDLQIFKNDLFGQVRTIEIDGKIYFVAIDIARALDYKDTTNAIKQHCRWVAKHHIPHPQNPKKKIKVNVIPEGDIYRLTGGSELPGAEKFESWIFDEVLPSIRKTGGYIKEGAIVTRVEVASKIAPCFITLGQTFGMSEQSAKTYAVQEMKKYIPDINYAPLLEGNVIEESLRTPTELGDQYGLSAIKFNRILRDLNYQYRGSEHWEATDKGEPFSDLISQEGHGTRLSLRWTKDILEQEDVINAIEEEYSGICC
ncbi:BRO family protein [Halocella sp. SP3-1]|uniref:BRO-N domain-containing protein n=1 Tax=Halocella sp. SP3-1 TaxID=2382161 RepID=UPI000F75B289|nr:BRO family protein [Halocella sp. SP3-1]AZO96131.1 hypothetical protein D7D81_16885 [Halocella sp. SP3-1]